MQVVSMKLQSAKFPAVQKQQGHIKPQTPVQTHSLDLIGCFASSDWDGIGGKAKDCHLDCSSLISVVVDWSQGCY